MQLTRAGICLVQYTDTQRLQTHNTHRQNTTPAHHPRPWPKPPTDSPYTTLATATKTQTHIPFSHVPPGLVKLKPNPLTRSPPTPPARAKHIHMSHTPSTPFTTLISSTSPVLDKTPEPRVPPNYALTATTPYSDPHHHFRHPRTLTFSLHTHLFKTTQNNNIIPHTWRLGNIVPIPKPNKDIDNSTSYRPITLHSVIAKTLEKCLLPYITANIPNTPMQHGYKHNIPQ